MENNNIDTSIFKAYDIRGIYPSQVNEEIFYKIGQAYGKFLTEKNENKQPSNLTVVVGRDVRNSGEALFEFLTKGLMEHGINVVDIGIITTDMMYFAVANYGYDGGLAITASHNPAEYNGIKMVLAKGAPISGDTGIYEIRDLVVSGYAFKAEKNGELSKKDILEDYIQKVLSIVDYKKIKPMKIVANINFGPMAKNLKRLAEFLPVEIIWLNEEPNGNFPKGRPDPLIPENRLETEELIKKHKPNFGVAWDSDADRCFFFDENGRFLSGYFTTAVLSEYFLKRYGGGKVLMDSKLNWAVADTVKANDGQSITTKTGHSFYKQKMIEEQAIFGGEVSAHMFFKEFYNLDNGLMPLLVIMDILSGNDKQISEIYNPYFEKYFPIEETNFKVKDVGPVLLAVKEKYADANISELDGIALEYGNWRCSVRSSNTEPTIRLNLEARSAEVREEKFSEIVGLINKFV